MHEQMSISCQLRPLLKTFPVRASAKITPEKIRKPQTVSNESPLKPTKQKQQPRIWKWKSPYDGQIFELAGPALLTLAADPLLSIVDTIYVGKLGSVELASPFCFSFI